MGQQHDEREGTPDGATPQDDGGPGRGASGRSGSDGNFAPRHPARLFDTRPEPFGTRGPGPLGGFLRRLLRAMVTVAVIAGGAVLTPDLLDGPITLPPGPFTPPTGQAEPSVVDELGPDHGAISGFVPRWEDFQRAVAEKRSSAATQDADPAPQDADPDTLVAEPTEDADDSVTVDIDRIRDEMHEVELPVESDLEPEPESESESQSGHDEDEPSEDSEGEWCSGIAHLLPGAGDGFASGVWVWAQETQDLDGRWVWISEEPNHPCFADNTPAGVQAAEGHDAPAFVSAYGAARSASDVDGLLNLVHPAIRGLFGDDSCRELLGHSPWAVVAAEAVDVGEIQPWHFEFDTGVVSFPEAVPVGVHHVLHDDGEVTIPFTLPILAGRAYLAADCDHRTP